MEISDYQLLDAGDQLKLERLGPYRVIRQAAQAFWPKNLPPNIWREVDAVHHRSTSGGGHWEFLRKLPASWQIRCGELVFKVKLTDFGHIGLFPEQRENWSWIRQQCGDGGPRVLNLFGYSGGSTLAAALAGAQVTHVDASKGVVTWARENLRLNGGEDLPVRWIVEDVAKYINREQTRGSTYQGLILDPPTYGRGPKGQTWRIETDLIPLLHGLKSLMERPRFVLLSCHTPGYSPICLKNILYSVFGFPPVEMKAGEMVVPIGESPLPSGTHVRWSSRSNDS